MDYVPSKTELCQTDQILFSIAFVSFVFTIAIILMLLQKHYPFHSMVMDDYLTFFLYPLAACMALPYFFYRCNHIRSLFAKGEEVVAQVTFMDDDLRPWFVIRYEFIYEDNIYNQTLTIMHTKKSIKIAEKKEIVVMFDPICKRSYIRDVF